MIIRETRSVTYQLKLRNNPPTPPRSPTLANAQSVVCVKTNPVLSSELRAYRQGPPTMLPAKRNKVDISVRTFFDPESDIASSIARLPKTVCDLESSFDAECVVDADRRVCDLIFIGFDRGGAEALSSLRQTTHSQGCVAEGAESPSLCLYGVSDAR